jgi:hypothetical protein
LKNCREHAELDLSINFKNFGKNFQIDILAIKISFPEYFFPAIFMDISTLPGIYNCSRDKAYFALRFLLCSTSGPGDRGYTEGEGSPGYIKTPDYEYIIH